MPKYESNDSFELNHCGNPSKHQKILECTTSFVNQLELETTFNQQCMGKNSCSFNMISFIETDTNSSCKATGSKMYIQYSCDFVDEMIGR